MNDAVQHTIGYIIWRNNEWNIPEWNRKRGTIRKQIKTWNFKAEAGRDKEADSSIYCPLPKYVCVTVQK